MSYGSIQSVGLACNAGTQQDEDSREARRKAMDSAFQRKEWKNRFLQTIAKHTGLCCHQGGMQPWNIKSLVSKEVVTQNIRSYSLFAFLMMLYVWNVRTSVSFLTLFSPCSSSRHPFSQSLTSLYLLALISWGIFQYSSMLWSPFFLTQNLGVKLIFHLNVA